MSFTVEWYYPDRVLYTKYMGNVTSDEVIQAFGQHYAYLVESDCPIHSIIDISSITSQLVDLKMILKLKDTNIIQQVINHPKAGWAVYCNSSGNHFLNFFGSVFVQSFRLGKLKFVSSKEEAFLFLQTIDDHIQGGL